MKAASAASAREEIVQAIAELQERLDAEDLKEKMRLRLRTFLAGCGLTRRDVASIAAEVMPKKGAAPLAEPEVGVGRGNPGKPRARSLDPARGAFGKAVRAARLKLNMSGNTLADKIGGARGVVSQWERGKYEPTPAVRAKVAKVLGISPDALANGDARR